MKLSHVDAEQYIYIKSNSVLFVAACPTCVLLTVELIMSASETAVEL